MAMLEHIKHAAEWYFSHCAELFDDQTHYWF